MTAEYTISAVSGSEPKRWDSKYGAMETYRIKLAGQDEAIEINRKPGNVPEVNDKLYGDIQDTEYGKKFKAAKKPMGSGYQRDDSAIQAQWALGRAYEKHGATAEAITDAKWLFGKIDEIKSGDKQQTELLSPAISTEKADNMDDDEFASLIAKHVEDNEEVNLDDIPF